MFPGFQGATPLQQGIPIPETPRRAASADATLELRNSRALLYSREDRATKRKAKEGQSPAR